jgi:histidine ammonia-lyase
MLLFDPKTAGGLPPNLASWPAMGPDERHLHHGLKGLHQVTSALTSEIASLSMPTTVFSRSSESHNQDKVSLGMSAATACEQVQDKTFTVCALHLTCLAQALELKGIDLQGSASRRLFSLVRRSVPLVTRDQPLGESVSALAAELKDLARRQGSLV